MLDETWTWEGASGRGYLYYVYEGRPDVPSIPGNYVYAKRLNNQRWSALYIGEGDLARRCSDNAGLMACISTKGATHVHLRQNADRATRRAERQDLLTRYHDAFAPTGCHEPDQAVHTWTGASGREYLYYVYDLAECIPPRQGNFIYALRGDNDDWRPLYFGQGDISQRLNGDSLSACLKESGCTHVHLRLNAEQQVREFERHDLLRRYASALREGGCQPDDDMAETLFTDP